MKLTSHIQARTDANEAMPGTSLGSVNIKSVTTFGGGKGGYSTAYVLSLNLWNV